MKQLTPSCQPKTILLCRTASNITAKYWGFRVVRRGQNWKANELLPEMGFTRQRPTSSSECKSTSCLRTTSYIRTTSCSERTLSWRGSDSTTLQGTPRTTGRTLRTACIIWRTWRGSASQCSWPMCSRTALQTGRSTSSAHFGCSGWPTGCGPATTWARICMCSFLRE